MTAMENCEHPGTSTTLVDGVRRVVCTRCRRILSAVVDQPPEVELEIQRAAAEVKKREAEAGAVSAAPKAVGQGPVSPATGGTADSVPASAGPGRDVAPAGEDNLPAGAAHARVFRPDPIEGAASFVPHVREVSSPDRRRCANHDGRHGLRLPDSGGLAIMPACTVGRGKANTCDNSRWGRARGPGEPLLCAGPCSCEPCHDDSAGRIEALPK